MKLSEKLAALEQEEIRDAAPKVAAANGGAKRARPAKTRVAPPPGTPRRRRSASSSWTRSPRRWAAWPPTRSPARSRPRLDRIVQREDVVVTPLERRRFVQEVMSDTLGYGPLDPLLADESVTEVMCNSYDDIWVEREGRLERTDLSFTDDVQYRAVIDKIVSAVGRRVDEASPMVDARLPDGSRVNAIIPPLALNGAVLTIRKFAKEPFTAKDLINFGTWTLDLTTVMEACVRGKLNILVSGGTGTGKTTNLNVLSAFIPDGERIITIEDSAELQLQQPHVVNLETRPLSAEGTGQVAIRDLVKNALRMRPDRIIVGECRAAEALDMLQAMNTGHEGSMTTVHANSTRDAISRIETMVLMAGLRPAGAGHPRADRRRPRHHPAGLPHARRPPRDHRGLRGAGHGGRHHPPAGHLQVPHDPGRPRRRRARAHRPASEVPRQARRSSASRCRPRPSRPPPRRPSASRPPASGAARFTSPPSASWPTARSSDERIASWRRRPSSAGACPSSPSV